MRITFVSPTVNLGGGTRVIAIYADALARKGHIVRIVSTPRKAVPFRRKVKSFLTGNGWLGDPPPLRSHLDGSGLDHRVMDRWRPVTDNDVPDADVVIATWWETAEWVNGLGDRKGAKVYFVQGHEVFPGVPEARCRATYRLPLHKIAVSSWLKKLMHVEYGDTQVDIVPNSVNHGQFFAAVRGKQPRPTIGFLYSLSTHVKGVDVALRAVRELRTRFPDLRVISFGSRIPPPGELDGWIEFTHSPPQNALRNLYALCDVWISSSRSEGFNLPAMEAMACRTPVVSTRTGWPDEAIVPGDNGILVDVDDLNGLVSGVEWVLSLPDREWRRVSRNAYDAAAAGSWAESADRFEKALVHACQRASRGEITGRPVGEKASR
jgi:glycosyltransferase involved in cell wall biosynthesis